MVSLLGRAGRLYISASVTSAPPWAPKPCAKEAVVNGFFSVGECGGKSEMTR